MTPLDKLLHSAYQSQGAPEPVNRFYLSFLQSTLLVPVKKDNVPTEEEPFAPLYAKVEDKYYILAFDTETRLEHWAGSTRPDIAYVPLLGRDLIVGINENVWLCLNLDTEYYKEFTPDEVKHLKKIISKIDQLKHSTS